MMMTSWMPSNMINSARKFCKPYGMVPSSTKPYLLENANMKTDYFSSTSLYTCLIHQERRYFAFMLSYDLGAAIGKLTVTDAFYWACASRHPRLVHIVIRPYFDAGRPEAPVLTLRRDAPSSDIHPHVLFCCCRLNALASVFSPSSS